MSPALKFDVLHRDGATAARVGRLRLPHGEIETPLFMPVGTQATVKALCQEDLRTIGAGIILGNAYHLYLRPGTEVLEAAGGIHRFMDWDGPVLTDSGGFQVFSLNGLNKVTPEGVTFQSHLDGSRHFFSPESAIDTQISIGADIIMCFDECTAYPVNRDAGTPSGLTINYPHGGYFPASALAFGHRWWDYRRMHPNAEFGNPAGENPFAPAGEKATTLGVDLSTS